MKMIPFSGRIYRRSASQEWGYDEADEQIGVAVALTKHEHDGAILAIDGEGSYHALSNPLIYVVPFA